MKNKYLINKKTRFKLNTTVKWGFGVLCLVHVFMNFILKFSHGSCL